MTRATLIGRCERLILQLIPEKRRPEARTLLTVIHDQFATLNQDHYTAGVTAATTDAADRAKLLTKEAGYHDGFQEGWKAGYAAGLENAIGRIGSPARQPVDDAIGALDDGPPAS